MRGDQGEKSDPTIFVAVAAYCEPELRLTLEDCIAKAAHPGRLRFGICMQYDNGGEPEIREDCIDDMVADPRFRLVKYHYQQSRGGCWARHIVQSLYHNEDYTLQVDSHTRFLDNWDVELVEMLAGLPSKKPLITGFPNLYLIHSDREELMEKDHPEKVGTTIIERWEPDGSLVHPTRYIPENISIPRRTRMISGAFVFTHGQWNREVTQDPRHLYWGEEFALTLRSFTSGYDLFNPIRNVVWHRLHFETNRKFINESPEKEMNEIWQGASRRLEILMAGDSLGQLGHFSLGRIRTLYDYYLFSGIHCGKRTIHEDAINGVPPDPVTIISE